MKCPTCKTEQEVNNFYFNQETKYRRGFECRKCALNTEAQVKLLIIEAHGEVRIPVLANIRLT